ncbi:MAG: DUF721 domain-containing protein [Desulfobacterales bacterium]|nr:DUF721 domain-containing protein [Desulfobacterales bacterium]
MARMKKTLPLGDLVSGVLKRADKQGKRYGALAVNAWREVVGDEIARHTRGFALRDGRELIVFVDSAAWANQLSLMSDDLQTRLNSHLGEKSVSSLRFTVSRKVADEVGWEELSRAAEEYYAREANTPLPLDDIELGQVAQVARMVKNTELREAALRVMIKDLEQKKGARSTHAGKGPEEPL